MRTPARLVVVATLAAASLVQPSCSGCGASANDEDDDDDRDDGDEGEGEGDGTPMDAHELCVIAMRGQLHIELAVIAAFASAGRCDAADLEEAQDQLIGAAPFDELVEQSCQPGTPALAEFADALDGGRVEFFFDRIRACAALDLDILTGTVSADDVPPNCATLTRGLVAEGDPCVQHWDCEDGTRCEAAALDRDELVCRAPAALGEPCLPDSPAPGGQGFVRGTARSCADDLACTADAGTSAFTCSEKADASEPCGSDDDCKDGLACSDDDECVAPAGEGDACTPALPCDDDLTCVDGRCHADVEDGAACVAGDDCAQACSVCRPTTPGGATTQCLDRGETGAPCASNEDCHKGFVCGDAGACVVGGDVDDPCEVTADCRDGLVCFDGDVAATCQVEPQLGDPCDPAGVECAEGACFDGACRVFDAGDSCDAACPTAEDAGAALYCIDDACGPAPSTGPCVDFDVCADGSVCVEDADGARTCQPAPGDGDACLGEEQVCGADLACGGDGDCHPLGLTGAACTADEQCVNGSCVSGRCAPAPASCLSDNQLFPVLVLFSGCAIPLRLRRRCAMSPSRRNA